MIFDQLLQIIIISISASEIALNGTLLDKTGHSLMLVIYAHHPFEIFILFFEPLDLLFELLDVVFLSDSALFGSLTVSASLLVDLGLGRFLDLEAK